MEQLKKSPKLRNRIKHPSGKFSIVVTDAMKKEFDRLYQEDLKKREKENGTNKS